MGLILYKEFFFFFLIMKIEIGNVYMCMFVNICKYMFFFCDFFFLICIFVFYKVLEI